VNTSFRLQLTNGALFHYKDSVLGRSSRQRRKKLRCLALTCFHPRMPWDILLVFFVLGVIVPWRGRAKLKQLLAKPRVEPAERMSLYASTIVFQWIAAAVVAWRVWAHGFSATQLGLTVPSRLRLIVITVLGAVLIVTLQWLNLRRIGRSRSPLRAPIQALAERILPQSTIELIPFLGLAITAGFCEEFLYRGFAMAVLSRAGLPTGVVIILSAVLFGMAHLYQGRAGLVSTTVLGLLLGTSRAMLGSLLPVVAWHTGVDVVAGVAGPRYLVHNMPLVDQSGES
jgi:membrane protease YdiL (CAAX protease family)